MPCYWTVLVDNKKTTHFSVGCYWPHCLAAQQISTFIEN